MSNKKQSSIDKFVQQLKRKGLLITEDSEYIVAYLEAKAMHKEEIQDAYRRGFISDDIKLADDYYNETFGGDNEQSNR
jgi:hypothetical protein